MKLTDKEMEMLKRIMDNGIFKLDRSYKYIGSGPEHAKYCEIPAELFPDVERLLNSKGYRLINRDTAKLDPTRGAVGRMLEG